MSEIDSEPFPRGALIAATSLIGLVLVGTTVARIQKITTPQPVPEALRSAPAAYVDLAFADKADGSVAITNRGTGQPLGALKPGNDGFIRGVMRGLAHDRLRRHIGDGPAFRLSEMKNGALYLEDTATGRIIDLQAFGKDNKAAFQRFLPAGGVQASVPASAQTGSRA